MRASTPASASLASIGVFMLVNPTARTRPAAFSSIRYSAVEISSLVYP